MIYLEEIHLQEWEIPFLLKNYVEKIPCMLLEQSDKENYQFLATFVRYQERFPVYMVIELFNFMTAEVKEELSKRNIHFRSDFSSDKVYFILSILEQHLEYAFNLALYLGKMNQFVGWALGTKEELDNFFEIDVTYRTKFFGFYKKKIAFPSISLSKNQAFFWIGYDGKEIWIFSLDEEWNQLKNLKKKIDITCNELTDLDERKSQE